MQTDRLTGCHVRSLHGVHGLERWVELVREEPCRGGSQLIAREGEREGGRDLLCQTRGQEASRMLASSCAAACWECLVSPPQTLLGRWSVWRGPRKGWQEVTCVSLLQCSAIPPQSLIHPLQWGRDGGGGEVLDMSECVCVPAACGTAGSSPSVSPMSH